MHVIVLIHHSFHTRFQCRTQNMVDSSSFPELSSHATEEEKNLSLKEKINLIDNEIRQLYEFCLKAGYTQPQIEECSQPLLAIQSREKRIKWFWRLCSFAVFVGFVAFLFACDPTYRQICIYGKFVAMKALPYWDWTVIYDKECLIDNPYKVQDGLTEEDCGACQHLKGVKRIANVSQSEIAESFLFNQIPVIVTDAMEGWDALEKFDLSYLAELYEKNEVLAERSGGCQFQSTLLEYEDPQQLMSAYKSGELTKFQAFWENCDKDAAKVFRKYHKRPYFLPPMAEAVEGNWFIVSSAQNMTLQVHWESTATWIAQIKGTGRFILTPDEICKNLCHKVAVNLDPGEVLTVMNTMWNVQYRPIGNEPVISFGSGVTWD